MHIQKKHKEKNPSRKKIYIFIQLLIFDGIYGIYDITMG